MTPERFSALIDAYGGDPKAWPDTERAAAEAYAERTPAARAALAEARRLDALLAAWPQPAVAPDPARLVALATAHAQETLRPEGNVVPFVARAKTRRTVLAWARAGALAAAGICGLIVGMNGPLAPVADNPLDLYDAGQVEETLW